MRTAATALLLFGVLYAQDPAPTDAAPKASPPKGGADAAPAKERPPIPVHFDAGSVDIMPGLDDGVRYRLKRWVTGPVRRAKQVGAEIAKLDKSIREERDKERREKLAGQRKAKAAELAKLRQQARAEYDKIGVTEEQLARLNSIPHGELRRERYNHGVMLEAPDLNAAQTSLLRACISAVDSAQLALAMQRRDVARNLADQDEKIRQRVQGDLNNRIRAIEKRFWLAMYYVLTPAQMRATKPLRCPVYQRVGDHRNHLYMLPGLSATQAGRINSLLSEVESETAADDAVIRALQRELGQKDLDKPKRDALQGQLNDAYRRRGKIYSENYAAIRELMTDEQEAAWDAIPPQLSGGETGRGILQNLAGFEVRPDQAATMRRMGAEAEKEIRESQKEMLEATKALRESGMGADSPQMMMMNTMQRGVQGDRARVFQELGHKYCVEVWDPEQFAVWIAVGASRP